MTKPTAQDLERKAYWTSPKGRAESKRLHIQRLQDTPRRKALCVWIGARLERLSLDRLKAIKALIEAA